ncbi:MAG: hypothetical protein KDI56_17000 [Xanthomonadales bacterium]|nr:hypothetical protein [Xanthomonadales bacterium]
MAKLICADCGSVGTPKIVTKGSLGVEIFLWLLLLVPGLLYSLWRMTTKHKACRACGQQTLLPLDSPRGRKLQAEMTAPSSPSE